MVTEQDVYKTLLHLGVKNGDILLIHSSLKSFGEVENGADTVIDGALDAVGKDGTVVVPTLLTKSFKVAYEIFDKDTTPSEVGIITETLRCRKEALRSNQETHSVAAIGKHAEFLTCSHKESKPRIFPYGDYAFSHGSPWQKMYDLNAKVVMMGAPQSTVTFRHFVEAVYCENMIEKIKNQAIKAKIISRLVSYDRIFKYDEIMKKANYAVDATEMIRFQFGTRESQTIDPKIAKTAHCGNSLFTLFNAKDYVDGMLKDIENNQGKYFNQKVLDFINEIKSLQS